MDGNFQLRRVKKAKDHASTSPVEIDGYLLPYSDIDQFSSEQPQVCYAIIIFVAVDTETWSNRLSEFAKAISKLAAQRVVLRSGTSSMKLVSSAALVLAMECH